MKDICLKICILSILIFTASACADEDAVSLTDSCDWYGEFRPIPDILSTSEVFKVYIPNESGLINFVDMRIEIDYYQSVQEFDGIRLFSKPEVNVSDRISRHGEPKFLLDLVSKPPAYFYEIYDTNFDQCRVIPLAAKGQPYLVAISNNRISMFEPFSEELESWVTYFTKSRGLGVN
jgi:hypothetical protein